MHSLFKVFIALLAALFLTGVLTHFIPGAVNHAFFVPATWGVSYAAAFCLVMFVVITAKLNHGK